MSALQEGQVHIPEGRLSYPKLYEPKAAKGDPNSKPRYGCKILIPKSDEATKAKIDKEIARLIKAHLKGVKPRSSALPIVDGDGEDGDEYSKGHWVLSANRAQSQGPPQVVDRQNKAIDSKNASTVYAGCHCDFMVGFFFQSNWGRICCGLEIVRKKRDGESFGAARQAAEEVMPELPDDEEEEAGFGV
jgi:hypothetical protein